MAEDFDLRLIHNGLEEFKKYLKRLKLDSHKIHMAATYEIARKARDLIKEGYQKACYSYHPGTLEAYARPAPGKRRWGGGNSLIRSGILSRSVVVRRKKSSYQVQIDPKKIYGAGGDPKDAMRGLKVEFIAAQTENPKPYMVRMTAPMKAYLAMIARESGKPQAATGSGIQVGATFLVQPRAKPVWGPVWKEVKKYSRRYNRVFNKYLRMRGPRRFPRTI